MGRSPDEIRSSIDQTRDAAAETAAETVAAAKERLDVAGRAQDTLSETAGSLGETAGTAQRALQGDPEARRELSSKAEQTWEALKERPATLAAVAGVAGLVLGRLTKRRR